MKPAGSTRCTPARPIVEETPSAAVSVPEARRVAAQAATKCSASSTGKASPWAQPADGRGPWGTRRPGSGAQASGPGANPGKSVAKPESGKTHGGPRTSGDPWGGSCGALKGAAARGDMTGQRGARGHAEESWAGEGSAVDWGTPVLAGEGACSPPTVGARCELGEGVLGSVEVRGGTGPIAGTTAEPHSPLVLGVTAPWSPM